MGTFLYSTIAVGVYSSIEALWFPVPTARLFYLIICHDEIIVKGTTNYKNHQRIQFFQ